jgi:hypothetical protein
MNEQRDLPATPLSPDRPFPEFYAAPKANSGAQIFNGLLIILLFHG